MREAVAVRLGTPVGRLILKGKNSRNSRLRGSGPPKRSEAKSGLVRIADTRTGDDTYRGPFLIRFNTIVNHKFAYLTRREQTRRRL
jgi:hypothetical protein